MAKECCDQERERTKQHRRRTRGKEEEEEIVQTIGTVQITVKKKKSEAPQTRDDPSDK